MASSISILEEFNPVFYPESVAVVGASDSPLKGGHLTLLNLMQRFKGKIYPVNSHLPEILGLKAYPSLSAIPGKVDLALIVVPAPSVLPVMKECAQKRVKGVIITTSGFRELGEPGAKLQDEVTAVADEAGIKVIGPNTFGMVNPYAELNAGFGPSFEGLKRGHIAVITQSGGVCALLLDSMIKQNIGVSLAMSLGNRGNIEFSDLIKYLAEEPRTKVIALYLEGIEEPRKLMEAAKQVVNKKPIVAYKVAQESLSQATYSHTGSLAGKYELYRTAFAQAGIIQADNCTELIDIAKALAFQPPPRGNRVAIVTTQGGPGIIAAYVCQNSGLTLANLSSQTKQRLRELIGPLTSCQNPIDVAWAARDVETSEEIIAITMDEEGVDALIINALTHGVGSKFKEAIISLAHKRQLKPLVFFWDSSTEDDPHIIELEENNIPAYPLPDRAAEALSGLVKYGEILSRG
jgi:acyl-CoA synthetase (NDP forming)